MCFSKKQTVARSIPRIHSLTGKYAGEDNSLNSPNTMTGEYIQRIINVGAGAPFNHQIAHEAAHDADGE